MNRCLDSGRLQKHDWIHDVNQNLRNVSDCLGTMWPEYQLPQKLIAQTPALKRDHSRLMVVDPHSNSVEHKIFHEIETELQPGDLLVVNDTAVFPARLRGQRSATGGQIEALLLECCGPNLWRALVRRGRRLKTGEALEFGPNSELKADISEKLENGQFLIQFPEECDLEAQLRAVGEIPLPPYIDANSQNIDHQSRYQTVFARETGAVAAPTAGLHFTKELLQKLSEKGIEQTAVTLHVGLGTFRPIREAVEDHEMHFERYNISLETAQKIHRAKAEGRRIIAVGTTTVRTLESFAKTQKLNDKTNLFIRKPYQFALIDGLITNFHLPRSTLLLLVEAFAGTEIIQSAYVEAMAQKYRFYSYGDAMFVKFGNSVRKNKANHVAQS